MIHVRRRIQGAQRAIQVGAVEVVRYFDTPGEEGLEAVARPDVFLDALDIPGEPRLLVSRASLGRLRRRRQCQRPQWRLSAEPLAEQPDLTFRGLKFRAKVGLGHSFGYGDGNHDAAQPAQVVQDQHGAREDEQRVRRVPASGRWRREAFDRAHDVVREVTDRSRPESAQLRHGYRRLCADASLKVGDRVVTPLAADPSARRRPRVDLPVAQPPGGSRLGPHERVPRPGLRSRGRRFEEERKGGPPDLGECRDRGVRVEEHVLPDGHECAWTGEFAEAVEPHELGDLRSEMKFTL